MILILSIEQNKVGFALFRSQVPAGHDPYRYDYLYASGQFCLSVDDTHNDVCSEIDSFLLQYPNITNVILYDKPKKTNLESELFGILFGYMHNDGKTVSFIGNEFGRLLAEGTGYKFVYKNNSDRIAALRAWAGLWYPHRNIASQELLSIGIGYSAVLQSRAVGLDLIDPRTQPKPNVNILTAGKQ